ncbi:MAG TPA: HutD family protein [Candidatus Caccocola faecigallinarum]|nr:HutD family protein [Candidatus Caccocola faecigallinarum]
MKVEVKRKDELSHNRWSGGVTTQLAIWPEGADYGARRFDWRISTAIVEDEKSVFTALPGIHRLLMILDGEIEVTHNGERMLAMKPLADVDEFEGGWETVSVGRCVDFNLMTVDGYRGAMSACAAGGGCAEIAPEGASEYWRGIYSLTDGLTVKCAAGGEEGEYKLDKGDFLLFSYSPAKEGTARVSLRSACGGAPAVCAEVWR